MERHALRVIQTELRRHRKKISKPANYLLVLLLALSGCISRIEYFYLVLEGDSLVVESRGRIDDLAIPVIYMRAHEPMATSYSLSRDAYTIRAELPTDTPHPVLIFSATDPGGTDLMLTGKLDDECAAFVVQGESLKPIPDGSPIREMGLWWHGAGRSCWIGSSFAREPKPVEILVMDTQGRLLGQEKLTYQPLQNGEYWTPDGL